MTKQWEGSQPPRVIAVARFLGVLSAIGVFVIYLAGLAVSYRAAGGLDVEVSESPAWLYPVVVVGLVIVGSLGLVAATIDPQRTSRVYPWLLVGIGTVTQILFGLVLTDQSLDARNIAVIVLPPFTAALSIAEFARELRNLLRPQP
ncbi:hypothetical protein [Plantactinospora soyae]|uniref:Multidrug transporter EmrE-like cation transporter n=1 Tax=Plantactinospora soyae TaxID=1544732 RepID=A0A927M885_9ACTN|nr:hypothetical protein [Plantactinospora soyae]MBE1489802.1 multidrug transporter EmrE-like cation transporter [Plantactinospora soyae]